MKILEIVFDLGPGGAERFAVDLSNELSINNELSLIAIKNINLYSETRQFYLGELSSRVHFKSLGLKDGFSIRALYEIPLAIAKEQPDVVHLHIEGMPIFCILAILLFSNRFKFVQTIHNDLSNGYSTLFYKFLFNTLGRWGKYRIATISNKNHADFVKAYPFIKYEKCIRNGRADIKRTPLFDIVKSEFSLFRHNNSLIFIHVARIDHIKNQDLLVKAFNAIVAQGYNVELLFIGPNQESELGTQLKAKANKHIHFLGPKKNISDYLLQSDIFCLSSLKEGMPISIIEALLAKKPVVCTPTCGAIDVIVNGENGYLSSDFSLEAYITALQQAISHYTDLQHNISKNNKEEYSIRDCAQKYISFFSE